VARDGWRSACAWVIERASLLPAVSGQARWDGLLLARWAKGRSGSGGAGLMRLSVR
jgi:hypothetical protein